MQMSVLARSSRRVLLVHAAAQVALRAGSMKGKLKGFPKIKRILQRHGGHHHSVRCAAARSLCSGVPAGRRALLMRCPAGGRAPPAGNGYGF